MELKVYRQGYKERPDGSVSYKGEDARPYVSDRLFFVADGMGGAASIRHTTFDKELFDEDKLFKVLFRDVYDCENEDFRRYVKESFFEFYAIKDHYFESVYNMKKSGYFASRIVSAILLQELEFGRHPLPVEELFSALGEKSEEERALILQSLGERMAAIIREKLIRIAANANLTYESALSGLALLGTTLCATLYREGEDCVEAVYFMAGDSRPYVWDQKGLCQVIADQENSDGSMTNYIKANEDETFTVDCHYQRFEKPCILFNASDGCFDCRRFVGPMSFEKVLLDGILSADSPEEAGRSLTAYFEENERGGDDSSTIAMKMFGYRSYDEVKAAAGRRLAEMNELYFHPFPEILEQDYTQACAESSRPFTIKLNALRSKLEGCEAVKAYCATCVTEGKYPPYVGALLKVETAIQQEKAKEGEARVAIGGIAEQNFEKILSYMPPMENPPDEKLLSKLHHLDFRRTLMSMDYVSRMDKCKSDFDNAVRDLGEILDEIYRLGVPSSFSDYDEISFRTVEECERTMDALFAFFSGLKNRKMDAVKKLTQWRAEYIAQNRKLAAKCPEVLETMVELLITKELSGPEIGLFADDQAELEAELDKLNAAERAIRHLETEKKTEILEEAANGYWKANSETVIREILTRPDGLPEEVAEEARAFFAEMDATVSALREKSERQSKLFEAYDVYYSRYMEGTKS